MLESDRRKQRSPFAEGHHNHLIEAYRDRGHWRTSADKQVPQVEKTTIAVRVGIRHISGAASCG
jgi:hypothetical protein